MYALTSANAVGEAFALANSLLRLNPSSGAAALLCTLDGAAGTVRAAAFINRTHLAHFYGTTPPRMDLLEAGRLASGRCTATYVLVVRATVTHALKPVYRTQHV